MKMTDRQFLGAVCRLYPEYNWKIEGKRAVGMSNDDLAWDVTITKSEFKKRLRKSVEEAE